MLGETLQSAEEWVKYVCWTSVICHSPCTLPLSLNWDQETGLPSASPLPSGSSLSQPVGTLAGDQREGKEWLHPFTAGWPPIQGPSAPHGPHHTLLPPVAPSGLGVGAAPCSTS